MNIDNYCYEGNMENDYQNFCEALPDHLWNTKKEKQKNVGISTKHLATYS